MASVLAPAAAPAAETLERAERAFREGVQARAHPDQARPHFRAAVDLYQALRRQGVDNPGLCRNLGNAALLAGDLPAALLAYRHGLRLAPADRVLRDNLEYARDQVGYPPGTLSRPAPDAWPPWLPRPPADLLLAVALALYGVGCVAVTRWHMGQSNAPLTWAVSALIVAAVLGLAWGVGRWQAEEETRHPLVVVAADPVPLRTGNGKSYPAHRTLAAVNRGMEARLLFVRGGWLQVEFPGGQVGWLQRESVLVDE
jgi:hypothetical protein